MSQDKEKQREACRIAARLRVERRKLRKEESRPQPKHHMWSHDKNRLFRDVMDGFAEARGFGSKENG